MLGDPVVGDVGTVRHLHELDRVVGVPCDLPRRGEPDAVDRVRAMRGVPALIKAYLRLGGVVGDGAFVDEAFNTTDVCLVLDTARLSERDLRRFTSDAG